MGYRIPNTFHIDAACSRLVEFDSENGLLDEMSAIRRAKEDGQLLIIGRGSNLLPTKDFDGIVVRSRIMGREVVEDGDDHVLLRCGSGETVDDVIAWAVGMGFYGMENLSLIPGEVGASAVQNVGAYGVEIKDVLHSVEAYEIETGRKVTIMNADCNYAYRQSRFKNEWKNCFVITHVTYRLSRTFVPHLDYGNIKAFLADCNIDAPTAQQLRQAIIDIRNSKLPDPDVEGNAGSFFMNPIVDRAKYEELSQRYEGMPHYEVDADHVKIPAGWMIDRCGWKGRSVGNAGVHARQALVLVNRGGATGQEVVNLCNMIRESVWDAFGVDIRPEVNII